MPTSHARDHRNNPTKAEYRLWYYLSRRQMKGFRFRRQQQIGRFIVDFVCYEKKLIVELDGGQHSEQQVYDSERTRWLVSQGFKVLRFWNNEVLGNMEGVLGVIAQEIGN